MPFVWWNVTDVTCQRFHITDPQLWTISTSLSALQLNQKMWSLTSMSDLMNVTNAWFDQMSSNATATQAPFGANWVQNTDGFDTMDAYNIMYTNSVVQSRQSLYIHTASRTDTCNPSWRRLCCNQASLLQHQRSQPHLSRRQWHCYWQSGTVSRGLERRERDCRQRDALSHQQRPT